MKHLPFNHLKRPLLQVKFEMRSLLAREPALVHLNWPIIWWTQYKNWGAIDRHECFVGRHTELVIDGYQGSGNSFATAAFKLCQEKHIQLAHHLHSPVQICKAVRNNIPVILTIRQPKDAVISVSSRWRYITLEQALRAYILFYERLLEVMDSVVVSPFVTTTQHFNRVIEEVNTRYGKRFNVFTYSSEHVSVLRDPGALGSEEEVLRRTVKKQLHARFETEVSTALLERAHIVYQQLVETGVHV